MTKLMATWLGEDEAYFEIITDRDGNEIKRPVPGPSFTYWGHVRFDKDKAVLIDPDSARGAEERLVLDQIVKKTPNMKKRFRVEPVMEKQEGVRRGDIRDAR